MTILSSMPHRLEVSLIHASVLVISANAISHKFARVVKEQLERSECPILGVVLNKVDMSQNKYYGKYYEKYYGKYGEK